MGDKKKKAIKLLIENPGLLSSEVACELELSSKELQEIYRQIKGRIQPVEERTFGVSIFFQRVLEVECAV